jgi:HK97 family phage major capsid protein
MTIERHSQIDNEFRNQQHRRFTGDPKEHMYQFRLGLRGQCEHRDMQESINSLGGYFVPSEFHDSLIAMLRKLDPLFDENVVTIVNSDNGGPIQFPQIDDTQVTAVIVTENYQTGETDVPVGNVTLPMAPTWRSKLVKASLELVQDSGYPLEDVLTYSFALRLARGIGQAFVPQLLSAAQLGATANGASANDGGAETGGTSIGSQDLESLVGSVDEAYRMSPKCRWLMRSSTLSMILKVLDKYGRPVFPRERNAAGEAMLLGFPVSISPSMPAVPTIASAGNIPVAFGDLSRFFVRVAKNASRLRIHQEQFAIYGQVGYEMFMRTNALLAIATSASDSPVKYLELASA